MHLVIVTSTLRDNSLGRIHTLWLIARELGWDVTVVATRAEDSDVWPPVAGTPFAEQCRAGDPAAALEHADAVIAYQVRRETFGRVRGVGVPLAIDVDDPGWEFQFGLTRRDRATMTAKRLIRRRGVGHLRLRRWSRPVPTFVANPSLRELYPGAVVLPHVKAPRPMRPLPSGDLRVGFIGTVKQGKGLALARRAVAEVGASLVITADKPGDARPNEEWVGRLSLEGAADLLEECHAIAALSDGATWRRYQLPMKVVDAMLAGRVVIGSDSPAIMWGLGDAGLAVQATLPSVVAALSALSDRVRLEGLAAAAYARAMELFTPAANAPTMQRLLRVGAAHH